MADVPLSLAIISTVSPVVAGALPLAVGWLRDAGRDKRAAAEQAKKEKQSQCVDLLRLARDFRVLVQETYESAGDDLNANAAKVLRSAADLACQADKVEFLISGAENEAAALAAAVDALAVPVTDRENRKQGVSLVSPDYREFDRCLVKFKRAARATFGDKGTAGEVEERPV